jgi:hypothetical protein
MGSKTKSWSALVEQFVCACGIRNGAMDNYFESLSSKNTVNHRSRLVICDSVNGWMEFISPGGMKLKGPWHANYIWLRASLDGSGRPYSEQARRRIARCQSLRQRILVQYNTENSVQDF